MTSPRHTFPDGCQAGFHRALLEVLPTLSGPQRDVLVALFSAPEQTQSAGEIGRQLGMHNVNVSNALYQVAMLVLDRMTIPPDEAIQLFPRGWRVLAVKGRAGLAKGFPWQLRPEVVEAMIALNWITDRLETDENSARASMTEGALGTITAQTHRRNSMAREQCLANFQPPICQVCSLDFVEAYGSEFGDCLHVHHLNPMALADGDRPVDPAKDLVPLCPNCHSVIHAHGTLRSIDEVRHLMQLQKKPKP